MNKVYVIYETDLQDKKETIIGVADSIGSVESMINEYYGGDFDQVKFERVGDSGIKYIKTLYVHGEWTVDVRVFYFNLNEL